ncbi:MAG TPA: sensor histidine kinase [Polaromonas sp.]
MGVAKEHQQAILQEFYRVPRRGLEEGFGLGLAIVSRLSEALGHPVGRASLEQTLGAGEVAGL